MLEYELLNFVRNALSKYSCIVLTISNLHFKNFGNNNLLFKQTETIFIFSQLAVPGKFLASLVLRPVWQSPRTLGRTYRYS